MEKKFRAIYGHARSKNRLYTDFVATEENAAIVAMAIAKGQDADWCVYKVIATGKEKVLWDCM